MIESDLVGKQLGNFVILADPRRPSMPYSLGEGAFGKVYLGKNIQLESQVAIKFLNLDATEDEQEQKELIALFKKEAKLWARFRHPNIVHVYDFGIYENNPFLVMEYVPKGNLQQRHANHRPLPILIVVEYVKQIANALHVLHQKGIIHRDIKPKNLLITEDERVLLADFGIATSLNKLQLQETTTPRGTIIYSAPEQLKGEAEPRSDQYALGIMVYEWLVGTPPFYTKNIEQLIYMQLQQKPPPLREKNHNISAAIDEVVLRALAKRPEERFPSIQAFAKALEHAVTLSQRDAQAVTLSNIASIPEAKKVEPTTDEPAMDEPAMDDAEEVEQEVKPTQSRIYFAFLFCILSISIGWGSIVGVLLQSWQWAASIAPLLALIACLLFYFISRKQQVSLFSHTGMTKRKEITVFWLVFFVSVTFSSLVTGCVSFSLLHVPNNTFNPTWMGVTEQIYIGLFGGVIITLLLGLAFTYLPKSLTPRRDIYSGLHLLIFSLLTGLVILLLLFWLLGLGMSSLESASSLLVGVIAMTGSITLLNLRKQL